MQNSTDYLKSIVDDNPLIIFFALAVVELVWNVFRTIFTLITVKYYLDIINEARQNVTIRLSDFVDTISTEPEFQEFRSEMLKEYPGNSHHDNVNWYAFTTSCFAATVLLDLMAMFITFVKIRLLYFTWLSLYLLLITFDLTFGLCFLRQKTNPIYLQRKWCFYLFNYIGFCLFRTYLIWMSYYVPIL